MMQYTGDNESEAEFFNESTYQRALKEAKGGILTVHLIEQPHIKLSDAREIEELNETIKTLTEEKRQLEVKVNQLLKEIEEESKLPDVPRQNYFNTIGKEQYFSFANNWRQATFKEAEIRNFAALTIPHRFESGNIMRVKFNTNSELFFGICHWHSAKG